MERPFLGIFFLWSKQKSLITNHAKPTLYKECNQKRWLGSEISFFPYIMFIAKRSWNINTRTMSRNSVFFIVCKIYIFFWFYVLYTTRPKPPLTSPRISWYRSFLVACCYRDSEIKELKSRWPWTSSALPIKIHLIKVFPCSNSQELNNFFD